VRVVEPGELVIVCCSGPREKIWGLLLRLDAVGAVVRGVDLRSVEDWLRQGLGAPEAPISPSTVLVPTHRVERIYLDEASGGAPGIGDRFAAVHGTDAREALAAEDAGEDRP